MLEHALSDRLLEGIDERLGRPRFDPHGDAIPDAAGMVHREPFVLLAAAAPGHAGRVLRVSDRDPELLRAVEAAGVAVGAEVTVTDAATPAHRGRRRDRCRLPRPTRSGSAPELEPLSRLSAAPQRLSVAAVPPSRTASARRSRPRTRPRGASAISGSREILEALPRCGSPRDDEPRAPELAALDAGVDERPHERPGAVLLGLRDRELQVVGESRHPRRRVDPEDPGRATARRVPRVRDDARDRHPRRAQAAVGLEPERGRGHLRLHVGAPSACSRRRAADRPGRTATSRSTCCRATPSGRTPAPAAVSSSPASAK